MTNYRLSRRAVTDLDAVAEYTIERFGVEQARRYRDDLTTCFNRHAQNRKIGRSAEQLARGLRRFENQSHIVFYQCDEGLLLVPGIAYSHGCNETDLRSWAQMNNRFRPSSLSGPPIKLPARLREGIAVCCSRVCLSTGRIDGYSSQNSTYDASERQEVVDSSGIYICHITFGAVQLSSKLESLLLYRKLVGKLRRMIATWQNESIHAY